MKEKKGSGCKGGKGGKKGGCKLMLALLACMFVFTGCTSLVNWVKGGKEKFDTLVINANDLKQIALDVKNQLTDLCDLRDFGIIPRDPDKPVDPERRMPPAFTFDYGSFKSPDPLDIVWLPGESTKTHVKFDYSNAPQWFKDTGSDTPCIVGAVYHERDLAGNYRYNADGSPKLIGFKYDWIGFSRPSRELKHITEPSRYPQTDPRFPDYIPPNAAGIQFGYNGWPTYYGFDRPCYSFIIDTRQNTRWLGFEHFKPEWKKVIPDILSE